MDDKGNAVGSGCCEGGDCCPPGGDNPGRKPARWKTLIFVVVILLAGAVAAYSLFWRSDNAASTSCCPPGSPQAAACGQAAVAPGFDHDKASVGLTLTALLDVGDALSGEQLMTVGDVRTALESNGEQLRFEVLRPGDSTYQSVIDKHQITSFPTFVIKGQEGVLVLNGDQFGIDTVKVRFKSVLAATGLKPEPTKNTL